MTIEKIQEVLKYCEAFTARADNAYRWIDKEAALAERRHAELGRGKFNRRGYEPTGGSKETASLRRASMDLTRVLAELRGR